MGFSDWERNVQTSGFLPPSNCFICAVIRYLFAMATVSYNAIFMIDSTYFIIALKAQGFQSHFTVAIVPTHSFIFTNLPMTKTFS